MTTEKKETEEKTLDNPLTTMQKYRKNKKEELQQYDKDYYQRTKQIRQQYRKDYRLENKQKINNNSKKNYQRNKEEYKEQSKRYCQEFPEKRKATVKACNIKHKKTREVYQTKYLADNRESIIAYRKEYNQQNRDHKRQYAREYSKKNRQKLNKIQREYTNERYKNDPVFRVTKLLRGRLYKIMFDLNIKKCGSTLKLLGCSFKKATNYLKYKFLPGMTHENYGEWHIDHIQPCASFNLIDPKEQQKCFHWTNLQPLWGPDNLSKSDKLDWVNPKEREVGVPGFEPGLKRL
jgi:hypothetical protein